MNSYSGLQHQQYPPLSHGFTSDRDLREFSGTLTSPAMQAHFQFANSDIIATKWGCSQSIAISSSKITVFVESSGLQLDRFVLQINFYCRVSDFSHLSISRGRKTLLWQRLLTPPQKKKVPWRGRFQKLSFLESSLAFIYLLFISMRSHVLTCHVNMFILL